MVDAWLSINTQIHMRGRRLNGDVGLRCVHEMVFTLHYCTVATTYTAACVGRGAVLYQLTDGPSNDIPHKEVIASVEPFRRVAPERLVLI